jgi:hypothetical protein
MGYNFTIRNINNSYVGFLNGVRATGNLDSEQDVKEQLQYIESIFNKYDSDIIDLFLTIDRKRMEEFLLNPKEMIYAFDLKQNSDYRKNEFNKLRTENISFKNYFDLMSFDKSIRY